jgi:hypothetical protein
MTMDIITASEPPLVHAAFPAEIPAAETPPIDIPIESLDLIESPKVRTKLRLYAILSALYVAYPTLVVNEDHLANIIL